MEICRDDSSEDLSEKGQSGRMRRLIEPRIQCHPALKRVFVSDPRKAGRTTLAAAIVAAVPGARPWQDGQEIPKPTSDMRNPSLFLRAICC